MAKQLTISNNALALRIAYMVDIHMQHIDSGCLSSFHVDMRQTAIHALMELASSMGICHIVETMSNTMPFPKIRMDKQPRLF